MRLLFIIDPIAQLKPAKDSSLAMMRAAQSQGHALWIAELQGMQFSQGQLRFDAQAIHMTSDPNQFQLGDISTQPAQNFDAIVLRKDPPFDQAYLYATYLLDLASQQGVKVLNHPSAVRDWNEKLAIAQFADLAPEFVVTQQAHVIQDFLAQHQDIIVKPLDAMGGSSIFRLSPQEVNLSVIIENMTQMGQRSIMVQRYVPEITQGDKRILLIHGEPLPYCLARIPATGETRANLAAGGRGEARLLTERDREIALRVGAVAKQKGLFLVGLDVIGDYLSEINVTSPTCMVEIAAQTEINPAMLFIQKLEQLCSVT